MQLVDTSAWVHCFRPEGDETIRQRVQQAIEFGDACWCDMTKLELWNGARGVRGKRLLQDVEQTVPLLPCDGQIWEAAFRVARLVRARGQTIPAADLLIFACARINRASILHTDKHLHWLDERIQDVI